MATLKIKPIIVQSKGNYQCDINGLDPTFTDCFEGEYTSPSNGPTSARWNLNGIMRSGPQDGGLNLDMSNHTLVDLVGLAKQLGAK